MPLTLLASSLYVHVGRQTLAGGRRGVAVAVSADHAVRVERARDAHASLLAST